MVFEAPISGDAVYLVKENDGLKVVFAAQWFMVGYAIVGDGGLIRLTSCSMNLPPASVDCQKLIDEIQTLFRER